MNTIKKLAFTLLIASATQVCASGTTNPVAEIAKDAAEVVRMAITTGVKPIIETALVLGANGAGLGEIDRLAEEAGRTIVVKGSLEGCIIHAFEAGKASTRASQTLLDICVPFLESHAHEIITNMSTLIKASLEAALPDPSQADEATAVLMGDDQYMAENKMHELMSMYSYLPAMNEVKEIYQTFNAAVSLGITRRS